MNNAERELIEEQRARIRSSFGDKARLYEYLFETMDNFYYRYIETTLTKNLKTKELSAEVWGAESFEDDMVLALKVKSAETKSVIMELAKTIPQSQRPKVRYALKARVQELSPDSGKIIFVGEVEGLKLVKKEVLFQYTELAQFRKELAIKLEETCEIFL